MTSTTMTLSDLRSLGWANQRQTRYNWSRACLHVWEEGWVCGRSSIEVVLRPVHTEATALPPCDIVKGKVMVNSGWGWGPC